jgi:hypothetical protein
MIRRHGLGVRVHVEDGNAGSYEASVLSHDVLSSLSLGGRSRNSAGDRDSIISSPLAGPHAYVKDERRYAERVCRNDTISPVQSTHGVFGFATPDVGTEQGWETAPAPFTIRRKPIARNMQLPTMHQIDRQSKALRRKALGRTPAFRQPNGRQALNNNRMNGLMQAT